MQTSRLTHDIIGITYRYVGSYSIYLGVKLGVFSSKHDHITAEMLQQSCIEYLGKTYQLSGITKLLDTLCAYELLTRDSQGHYKYTHTGRELSDKNIQSDILREFCDTRWNYVSKLTSEDFKYSNAAYKKLFYKRAFDSSIKLQQLLNGYQDLKMLQFAGGLNLFEFMHNNDQAVAELAELCNVDKDRMQYLLDYLTSLGIINKRENGYANNLISKSMRRDTANLITFVMHETPEKWLALGQLLHTFETNEDAFAKVHGKPLFEYLKQNPVQGKLFSEAMTAISASIELPTIVEQINFSGIVMDMGGGEGKLLEAIIAKNKDVTGIIFDLPEVIAEIRHHQRSLLRAGSFFYANDIPTANTIILKRVLHDWDDAKAIVILRNCQARLLKGGRILIIEYLADSALMAKADLLMMAIGGKSRSSQDFIQLAKIAGMNCNKVTALTPMLSMIELTSTELLHTAKAPFKLV